MMPLLTASMLLCGVAAMFSAGAMSWAWFAFGFMLWSTFTYFNIQQIAEHSDGEEGFLKGESDFRKLSVIVILTWFPFPCWFIVSPEGLGLVWDITIIQVGWAVLNVISKFGFILHLQHVKTRYCQKLEATRELYVLDDAGTAAALGEGGDAGSKSKAHNFEVDMDKTEEDEGIEKITCLVRETMVSLCLTSHCDRFLKLMIDSGVTSTDILERLTQDRSCDLNLPWSLVEAVMKRWKAEKMQLGQDNGGLVEGLVDPFKKMLNEAKARQSSLGAGGQGNNALPGQMEALMEHMMAAGGNRNSNGARTPPLAGMMNMGFPQQAGASDERVEALERQNAALMSQLQEMTSLLHTLTQQVNNSQEAICQRLDFSQVSMLQSVNSSQVLLHKLDSSQEVVLQKIAAQKDVIEKVSGSQNLLIETLAGSNDSAKQALLDTVASSSDILLKKLNASQEELLDKQASAHQVLTQVSQSQEQLSRKIDTNNDAASRRAVESDGVLHAKLQDIVFETTTTCQTSVGELSKSMNKDMTTVVHQNNATIQALEKGMSVQEERMGDVRRQNMMVMDLLTATQERVAHSGDSIEQFSRQSLSQPDTSANLEVQLRGVICTEMGRLHDEVKDSLQGFLEQGSQGLGQGSGLLDSTAAAERLEALALRLEAGASAQGQGGFGSGGNNNNDVVEEVVRREMTAMAQAMAQQQRDAAAEHVLQVRSEVGETVRSELRQTAEQLQGQVEKFEGALDKGIGRFEQGVDKVLASSTSSGSGEKAEKGESRRKASAEKADRG
ncbi:unnamed protein product [Polarella glacialis]|uniref:Golgi apparatus membrane protein TVP23 homolog n=1 Tax=Polarella glacialis TaxID=89957 RepID=A0A813FUC6_POLGL|nr:unnamed protein product [Polarella glacialis]